MPLKGWIVVDQKYCKGCEICIEACPKDVMSLDESQLTAKGYHPVYLHEDGCTGCGVCAVVCPDAALTVFREVKEKAAAVAGVN